MKMRDLIVNFPNQLIESLKISKTYDIQADRTIMNVVICGVGGSGIGGEIVKTWCKNNSHIPIEVCHSYELPQFVSSATLVIACSYSGNTEETLTALDQALQKNAFIIAITSGGKLMKIAEEKNFKSVIVPGGHPPRAALAYPLVQVLAILTKVKITAIDLEAEIANSAKLLQTDQNNIEKEAGNILKASGDRKFLFYAEDKFAPTLLRACQQINENSKELAFYNVIPEMNHNEIVGWANQKEDIFTVFLRSSLENSRNSQRINFTEKSVREKGLTHKMSARGNTLVEQTLWSIHLFDWISLLYAEKKNIDIEEVFIIEKLKQELANI
jgi:glucose/mannose-6-phosphate isomerase